LGKNLWLTFLAHPVQNARTGIDFLHRVAQTQLSYTQKFRSNQYLFDVYLVLLLCCILRYTQKGRRYRMDTITNWVGCCVYKCGSI